MDIGFILTVTDSGNMALIIRNITYTEDKERIDKVYGLQLNDNNNPEWVVVPEATKAPYFVEIETDKFINIFSIKESRLKGMAQNLHKKRKFIGRDAYSSEKNQWIDRFLN